MIVAPPGKELVTADFSNIEGRTLAWLAGQNDLVEYFRDEGPVYERMGAAIFGLTTEEVLAKGKSCLERELGKRAVLGCGYGMGAPKFKATCKKEGNLRIELSLAEKAVKAWRSQNDRIVEYWKTLESAAIEAVQHPGRTVDARVIRFKKVGSFLFARLPSGRAICYPYPTVYMQVWVQHRNGKKGTMPMAEARERQAAGDLRIEGESFPGLRYKGVDSYTRRWTEIRTYGGMMAENVASGMARDCLAEALIRLEDHGYPVVVHVHDEGGSEVEIGQGSEDEFQRLMAQVPEWAPGLPIKVEGWRGVRYRK
jgi:DNA polymerase